jgi:transcription initiation factor TFIID subunit 7
MSDRQPLRTLVLRILVPGLESRLRDKMKEMEEDADNEERGRVGSTMNNNSNNGSGGIGGGGKETLWDLDGVTCEPTQNGSTLWNFHCDGATYPARLVNLPCPIEIHKTHDHAMYYKSCDVAQMLIVYEDSMALDEADAYPKEEGYPSYYHSGVAPALKRVVERRFALREHQPRAPPRNEVTDIEKEVHELMCQISKEGGKRNKVPSLATAQHQNKILEEVVEEVVDFEPWMDDYGLQKSGIEFEAGDQVANNHPEIWLSPEKIDEIKLIEREKAEEELKKQQAVNAKKAKKKKKKEEKAAVAAAAAADAKAAAPPPIKKKGIASKKNEPPVDYVTQAAMEMTHGDVLAQALEDEEDIFGDLGFDLENDNTLDFDNLT